MESIAKILLETKAVTLNPNNPYIFASGIKSPIYCDNRIMISHVNERKEVVKAFLEKVKDLDFDVVAGTATAGIAWAAWIAEELGKPMVYVRSKNKGHGKQNAIEGKLEPGQKSLVVEDLVSTGTSSINAVESLREAGCVVENCVSIFDYELEKSRIEFGKANCKLTTITGLKELIRVAREANYLSEEEEETVMMWNKDPGGWSK